MTSPESFGGKVEKSPERFPTKESIISLIKRRSEGELSIRREFADEQGVYLLEIRVEGKDRRFTDYYFNRRRASGAHGDKNVALKCTIDVVAPEINHIATYNGDTGEWEMT